jgi:hypothetical protein
MTRLIIEVEGFGDPDIPLAVADQIGRNVAAALGLALRFGFAPLLGV